MICADENQDYNGKLPLVLRPKPYSAVQCKNWIHIYFSSLSTLMSYVSPVWFRFSCCLFPCVRSGSARQGFLHRESQSSQFSFENPGNVPSPGLPNLIHFHHSRNVPLWHVLITKACSILSYSMELFIISRARGKKNHKNMYNRIRCHYFRLQ